MPIKLDLPIKEIVRAYERGKHPDALATEYGVSSGAIRRWLVKAGVQLRTFRESLTLSYSKMSEKKRQQVTERARAARHRAHQPKALRNKARTKQRTRSMMTDDAKQLHERLRAYGFVPEYAVDKFNIDLAIPHEKLAVEVDGRSGWHYGKFHRDRDAFLRKHGWFIIRVSSAAEADYIVTLLERLGITPVHA